MRMRFASLPTVVVLVILYMYVNNSCDVRNRVQNTCNTVDMQSQLNNDVSNDAFVFVNGTKELNFNPCSHEGPSTWAKSTISLPLGFLHVPKTGGSSIVHAAAAQGISWADCLFPNGISECPASRDRVELKRPFGWPLWHMPTQFLPQRFALPYAGKDLFVVVRNPYERAVSEYYYRCRHEKIPCFDDEHSNDTAERMNAKLQGILRQLVSIPKNSTKYYMHWGHWVPQYDYVYSGDTKIVRHVLHTERLHEFSQLMDAYDLPIQLPQAKKLDRKKMGALLTARDLDITTMKLIELVFAQDFELGYVKLSNAVMGTQQQRLLFNESNIGD